MSDIDPLALALAPSPDETFSEKEARISAEKEAKRISDAIDDELDRQRHAEKRLGKHVKLLLLGMSHHFLLVSSVSSFTFRAK
jgi:guanine nucleotide-binding protein subunit alpha